MDVPHIRGPTLDTHAPLQAETIHERAPQDVMEESKRDSKELHVPKRICVYLSMCVFPSSTVHSRWCKVLTTLPVTSHFMSEKSNPRKSSLEPISPPFCPPCARVAWIILGVGCINRVLAVCGGEATKGRINDVCATPWIGECMECIEESRMGGDYPIRGEYRKFSGLPLSQPTLIYDCLV